MLKCALKIQWYGVRPALVGTSYIRLLAAVV